MINSFQIKSHQFRVAGKKHKLFSIHSFKQTHLYNLYTYVLLKAFAKPASELLRSSASTCQYVYHGTNDNI